MAELDIVSKIVTVINSAPFKRELQTFSSYFSNLKQEFLIRDALLKQLNEIHLPKDPLASVSVPKGTYI